MRNGYRKSSATSAVELGNDLHPARGFAVLNQIGRVSCAPSFIEIILVL